MPILEVKNLDVTYKTEEKQIKAVNNVSFVIEEQDSIGIVGESGSGKSTLAMAILRLLPERIATIQGEVLFNGVNIMKLEESKLLKLRWKEMAAVFQKSMNTFSPVHKIGHQMVDIYQIHETKLSKKEMRTKIIELLELVNLHKDIFNRYPHELSGGMLQRVSIALSLMHHPKLLILDEATTALDVVTQGQILKEINEIEEQFNTTRIMITHDISIVPSTCKQVVIMYAGKILESGDSQEVISNPKHPYTKGLLRSLPTFTGEKKNIKGIPGSLPDLSHESKGCIFADRCEHVMNICREQEPIEISLSSKHKVACHLMDNTGLEIDNKKGLMGGHEVG